MENLENALAAWRDILGEAHVLTDETTLTSAQTATFATTQTVPAIILPGNRAEIQACVRIANKYKTPIFPISTGKNWGYGSRVPVQNSCVIMELGRLNRIVDYNEKLAYVTVEPGVTQRQLFEYLRENQSNLFMSVTGSHPDTSLIGNILERGVGSGPHGDRFSHVCGFEIVLPTGECIQTGFERFANAKAAKVSRWGVGPYFDGLFTQSNLGIVTQVTIWLIPLPKYFQAFFFMINDDIHLKEAIDTLQTLRLEGLINFVGLWNDYKMLSTKQQYPWTETGGKTPLPLDLMESLRKKRGWGRWIGGGALYSSSKQQGKAERKLIEQALNNKVDKFGFMDQTKVWVARFIQHPYRWITGINLSEVLNWWYNEKDIFLGVPTDKNISSTYWRKKTPIPSNMSPDRDGCGVIWCSPVLPFDGQHVITAVKIIEGVAHSYQFEPNIAILCVNERSIDIVSTVMYDREVPGEDERAMACHDSMLQKLTEAGYIPYRLDIQSMNSLPPAKDDYGKLLSEVKKTLDPNNILAPGRYDFRKDWPNLSE
ncbi:FAD-linked oxidase [Candidatus Thiomargarita nelsonii]|uniref:FAD-linked oxidase n=1 Tax=Candidatus Thiomargarita nelsonii TaxID=1003181 RepID=A0A0A6P4U2_9GAMM|nr:FAD-linked oxidase [Candidatus Thiomargarita nelsonii]